MSSPKHISPPGWANRFLEWYCHEELLDEIQGDLTEQFHKNLTNKRPGEAKARYILDVLRFFRPSSFKKTQIHMNTQVISNYLKVAFRVFKKEKGYTFTNIFGLALGITCSLFIYLWVQDELSYNKWPSNLDKVHNVLVNMQESSGTIHTWWTTPQPLQPVLQEKYPAIEKAAMVNWGASFITKKGDEFLTLNGRYGTPEIFEVFSIPFIQGDHQMMFETPESIAISETAAEKYYGADWKSTNLVGSSITNKDGKTFKLAGIFKDIPEQSTLDFEFILTFDYLLSIQPWQKHWGNFNNFMYVKIADGYTTESAQANIEDAIAENRPDSDMSAPLVLQPFSEHYLNSKFENGKVAGGRIDYVRMLGISAILIILLASVNFVNLTTARSSKRSKETGIRKVLGAQRQSLRSQYMIEAILITLAAFILSGIAVAALLPTFNDLAGKTIGFAFFNLEFIITCLVFILALGMLSGLYPAFYMAALNPIISLKGIIKADNSNRIFRKGLVIFQFVITITMIIGSVTIYEQLNYVLNKNLGLDRENVLKTNIWHLKESQRKIYLSRLKSMPGIKDYSCVNQDPTDIGNSTSDPTWPDKDPEMEIYFHVLGVDPRFNELMDVEIKEGRDFDTNLASDSSAYIINEVTANLMGGSEAIGKELSFWDNSGRVIGIVKNFHIASLHTPIEPMILRMDPNNGLLLVKTKPGEAQAAIQSLEALHQEYSPERVFDYSFMDVDYQNRYKSEMLVSKLMLYFTIVAVVISCLGLLSLISFSTELKTKEIGIRKVLGASVSSILGLVGKEYIVLIVLSFIIASPIAIYIMNEWLSQYAYSISLNIWLFVIAAATALLITLATIANHAIRSATRNPVESLRTE
ncbi:MAG: hypothetical protein CMB80_31435 [Flammeovirgaceae bacterium]|nr:hypothetical protein [Flammeovirgaceae bacterium]MBE61952.1 hypothetical protein [Flammeovirgaceae bacterium]HCX23584.1 hypothetical protein [Cytophagales bacterium]